MKKEKGISAPLSSAVTSLGERVTLAYATAAWCRRNLTTHSADAVEEEKRLEVYLA